MSCDGDDLEDFIDYDYNEPINPDCVIDNSNKNTYNDVEMKNKPKLIIRLSGSSCSAVKASGGDSSKKKTDGCALQSCKSNCSGGKSSKKRADGCIDRNNGCKYVGGVHPKENSDNTSHQVSNCFVPGGKGEVNTTDGVSCGKKGETDLDGRSSKKNTNRLSPVKNSELGFSGKASKKNSNGPLSSSVSLQNYHIDTNSETNQHSSSSTTCNVKGFGGIRTDEYSSSNTVSSQSGDISSKELVNGRSIITNGKKNGMLISDRIPKKNKDLKFEGYVELLSCQVFILVQLKVHPLFCEEGRSNSDSDKLIECMAEGKSCRGTVRDGKLIGNCRCSCPRYYYHIPFNHDLVRYIHPNLLESVVKKREAVRTRPNSAQGIINLINSNSLNEFTRKYKSFISSLSPKRQPSPITNMKESTVSKQIAVNIGSPQDDFPSFYDVGDDIPSPKTLSPIKDDLLPSSCKELKPNHDESTSSVSKEYKSTGTKLCSSKSNVTTSKLLLSKDKNENVKSDTSSQMKFNSRVNTAKHSRNIKHHRHHQKSHTMYRHHFHHNNFFPSNPPYHHNGSMFNAHLLTHSHHPDYNNYHGHPPIHHRPPPIVHLPLPNKPFLAQKVVKTVQKDAKKDQNISTEDISIISLNSTTEQVAKQNVKPKFDAYEIDVNGIKKKLEAIDKKNVQEIGNNLYYPIGKVLTKLQKEINFMDIDGQYYILHEICEQHAKKDDAKSKLSSSKRGYSHTTFQLAIHPYKKQLSRDIFTQLKKNGLVTEELKEKSVVYDREDPFTEINIQYMGVELVPGSLIDVKSEMEKITLSDVRWIVNGKAGHILLSSSQMLNAHMNERVVLDVYNDYQRKALKESKNLKRLKAGLKYQQRKNKT